jgi:carbon storage regulator
VLVLSRQRDETIRIGDDIEVTVVDIRGDKVRLGINAPKPISVHRKEVYDANRRRSPQGVQTAPHGASAVLAETPVALLPLRDKYGRYGFADRSMIWPSVDSPRKWRAHWADRTPLSSDNDETSYVDTPEDAARALAAGGEGPGAGKAVSR